MHKLTLRLEDLTVDGFSTTPAADGRGTVRGEQGTHYTWCTCQGTCPPDTCAETCWETCDDFTCRETCDDLTCAETCGFSNCETRCGVAATCRCPDYQ
jgi:hypothetical protein